MSLQTLSFRITSMSPLVMHDGKLSDPTHPISREIKKISSKRKKTDADYEEMSRLEFFGGMYFQESVGPIIPAHAIEATFGNAAKASKQGKQAKAGLFVQKHAVLEYEGPRTREDLWENQEFVSKMPVRIGTSKVIRTRPIFKLWACTVEVTYDDRIFDAREIMKIVETAGNDVGFLEMRPKYGRFESVVLSSGSSTEKSSGRDAKSCEPEPQVA